MKVIASSKENMSAMDKYNMVNSPDREKLTDHKGEIITLSDWLIYEDTNTKKNADGSLTEGVTRLMTIIADDGRKFTTNSSTFISDFLSAYQLFAESGEKFSAIEVYAGRSKNNREFIGCKVVA